MRIDWDKSKNTVHYVVKLRGLPRSPQITRIDGGDQKSWIRIYQIITLRRRQQTGGIIHSIRRRRTFRKTHQMGQHIVFGRFRRHTERHRHHFTIREQRSSCREVRLTTRRATAGHIPVSFLIVSIVSSLLFYPSANGNASREWTVPYSQVTGEGGFWSWAPVAFFAAQPLSCGGDAADARAASTVCSTVPSSKRRSVVESDDAGRSVFRPDRRGRPSPTCRPAETTTTSPMCIAGWRS